MSQLEVENVLFELCEEFNKLNLRIEAHADAMKMKVGSSLL
jgi:hypothetical protein